MKKAIIKESYWSVIDNLKHYVEGDTLKKKVIIAAIVVFFVVVLMVLMYFLAIMGKKKIFRKKCNKERECIMMRLI